MTNETRIELKNATTDNIKVKVSSERITVGALMLVAGTVLIFAVGFAQGARQIVGGRGRREDGVFGF